MKARGTVWKPDEDQILRRMVKATSKVSTIAEMLGRSEVAVRRRIRAIGMGDSFYSANGKNLRRRWTVEDDDRLETMMMEQKPLSVIGPALVRSERSCFDRAQVLGFLHLLTDPNAANAVSHVKKPDPPPVDKWGDPWVCWAVAMHNVARR